MFDLQQQKKNMLIPQVSDLNNHQSRILPNPNPADLNTDQRFQKNGLSKKIKNLPELPKAISSTKKYSIASPQSNYLRINNQNALEEKRNEKRTGKRDRNMAQEKVGGDKVKRIGKLNPIQAIKMEIRKEQDGEDQKQNKTNEQEIERKKPLRAGKKQKSYSCQNRGCLRVSCQQRLLPNQPTATRQIFGAQDCENYIINIKDVKSQIEIQSQLHRSTHKIRDEQAQRQSSTQSIMLENKTQKQQQLSPMDDNICTQKQRPIYYQKVQYSKEPVKKHQATKLPSSLHTSKEQKKQNYQRISLLVLNRNNNFEDKVKSWRSFTSQSKGSSQASSRWEIKQHSNRTPNSAVFLELVKKSSNIQKAGENILKKQRGKRSFEANKVEQQKSRKSANGKNLRLHQFLQLAKEQIKKA